MSFFEMKVTFDSKTLATYIYAEKYNEDKRDVEVEKTAEEILVYTYEKVNEITIYKDLDSKGNVLGIEVLSPGSMTLLDVFRHLGIYQ